MIHGLTNGQFSRRQEILADLRGARPKLDVPIYLQPVTAASRGVTEVYYKEYLKDYPMVIRGRLGLHGRDRPHRRSAWCSAAFSTPIRNLKIILGHLGETLPFPGLAHRSGTEPGPDRRRSASATSSANHFYLTTSGNFLQSGAAVLCAGDGPSTASCSRSTGPFVQKSARN